MPNLYIIAGPNGAGKTTTVYSLLPHVLQLKNFVNADEIARGLSPFDVDAVAFEAGRIMLQRLDTLLAQGADFAFETTLATRSYVALLRRARAAGYTVSLLFVYLSSPELAIERVAQRVAHGGHHIPDDVVIRRYERSLRNLSTLYLPLCDAWVLIDNSGDAPAIIARKRAQTETIVYKSTLWRYLEESYGNDR